VKLNWLTLCASAALALLLLVAPMTTMPGQAQMGPMMGPPLDQLTGDEFDKAFLRQMTMHHSMAVEMAKPTAAKATHPELKELAQTIIDDQTREIAQMRAWAKDWYGMEIADPMGMMDQMMGRGGHMMPGMHESGSMPGMQSPGMGMPMHEGMPMHDMAQMAMMHDMSMMESLDKLPPARLEVVFMSQMVPHHQSAIEMARLVSDRASHQELKDLAMTIIGSQSSEIDKMNGWLASWYSL
jgi:uncharacterized protein (DUF305 family)